MQDDENSVTEPRMRIARAHWLAVPVLIGLGVAAAWAGDAAGSLSVESVCATVCESSFGTKQAALLILAVFHVAPLALLGAALIGVSVLEKRMFAGPETWLAILPVMAAAFGFALHAPSAARKLGPFTYDLYVKGVVWIAFAVAGALMLFGLRWALHRALGSHLGEGGSPP